MPGQGRKRTEGDATPVIEGELVPASLEELDEPTGREGEDELDPDTVEMAEDEDEEDEDEDEDAEADADADADADEDEDDEDDEDEDEDEEAEEGTEADR
jgi:hypothetical protein